MAVGIFVLLVAACGAGPGETVGAGGNPVDGSSVAAVGATLDRQMWAIHEGSLYTSPDGQEWAKWAGEVSAAATLVGRTLFVLNDSKAASVSSTDSVRFTADAGKTWDEVPLTVSCSDWVGVAFGDENDGLIVCFNVGRTSSTVMRSTDGGRSWVVASQDADTIAGRIGTNIVFSGPRVIWAAAISQDPGNNPQSVLATSTDGGSNWTDVELPGLPSAYAGESAALLMPPTFFGDGSGLFAFVDSRLPSGSSLRIWQTSDAGATWAEARLPEDTANLPVAFGSHQSWLAAGRLHGDVVRTDDGGMHWVDKGGAGLPPLARVENMGLIDPMHGWMIVDAKDPAGRSFLAMYVTQDGGDSWSAADFASH